MILKKIVKLFLFSISLRVIYTTKDMLDILFFKKHFEWMICFTIFISFICIKLCPMITYYGPDRI